MADLVVRDDETLDYLVQGHRDAVDGLVAELTAAGHDVELIVRPARAGVPMASGTIENVAIFVAAGTATPLLSKIVDDVYEVAKRWARRRHAEQLQETNNHPHVLTEFTIFGPDRRVLKRWSAHGPDETDE